jgi:Zn-dependent protease with chaperone function
MNFFEQQDLARRNTQRLIVLLVLAVLSLIAVTTVFLAGVIAYLQGGGYSEELYHTSLTQVLINTITGKMIAGISLLVISVVILGSLFKMAQLRAGGRAVAEAMGGRLLHAYTQDPDERKILNIVEEMAIASGTPVPPVYLIEEEGINAFAAGHNLQNAVIGVTRGCIHLLSRDELQGVIAHEFSHILHGDMRINLRLIAILHGILLLGLIGEYLLRSTRHGNSRSDRNNLVGLIVVIGLGLVVIGYTGTFFGNLIKSAVSRQREFLADASAVQFTRNPDGIAGALKKIGAHVYGSELTLSNAAEFSHMYFSAGITTAFSRLMATHPPLPDRIKRIQPRWDGSYPKLDLRSASGLYSGASSQAGEAAHLASGPQMQGFSNIGQTLSSAEIEAALAQTGQASAQHIESAQQQLAALGPEIQAAAHDSFSARALMFGLFLDKHPEQREKQWQSLADLIGTNSLPQVKSIAHQVLSLDTSLRLPLIELSIPALKELSQAQLQIFVQCLECLIQADNRITLMEWSLRRVILHHLLPAPAPRLRQRDLRDMGDQCTLLVSILAYAGARSEEDASAAFTAALEPLGLTHRKILPKSGCKLLQLEQALTQLNEVKPLQKPKLLKAMTQCIAHDNKITSSEAELFRAIADGLDCPVPPLILPAH